MIKEINLDGIYPPSLLGYPAGTAVARYLARYLLDRFAIYRFVWHPPLFNTALCVMLFGASVAATL